MTRTGLFFGSFNPVHIGHLAVANYMLEFENLDEVRFVISPQNPFKQNVELVDVTHRVEMTKLAISQHPRFKVETIELSLPSPSYTINTLQALTKKEPNNEFVIIMGADNIKHIHQWKGANDLIKNYQFLIYPRIGTPLHDFELPSNSKLTAAPSIEISSTTIRQWLLLGKQLPFFIPTKTQVYIQQHKLYKPTT